jgi:hypothetical protein
MMMQTFEVGHNFIVKLYTLKNKYVYRFFEQKFCKKVKVNVSNLCTSSFFFRSRKSESDPCTMIVNKIDF